MYSAVKVRGSTLYRLARRGIEVDRPERSVMIYDIRMTDAMLPYFDLEVSCSKGTYVRTICDDIGNALGTGAHLVALERSAVGFFDIADAVGLEDLTREDFQNHQKGFFSIDLALSALTEIMLDQYDYEKAKNGVAIKYFKFREL